MKGEPGQVSLEYALVGLFASLILLGGGLLLGAEMGAWFAALAAAW